VDWYRYKRDSCPQGSLRGALEGYWRLASRKNLSALCLVLDGLRSEGVSYSLDWARHIFTTNPADIQCKKAFRKDMTVYEEADEYCPHCDNPYVRDSRLVRF
jgi:hypothetical protein